MTNLKLSFSPRAGQGRHSALVHQSLLAVTCNSVLACPQGTLTRTLSYARVSVKFIRFPSTFQGVRIALRRGVAVGINAGQTSHSKILTKHLDQGLTLAVVSRKVAVMQEYMSDVFGKHL